ncbi:MAG TPA: NAD-glutamate dehydrogenase domain-containing protein, partial [Candidatus Binataceae bacterium]|nr:NAD-glutamate dehydrogenase domain-containing protein [Candidatus Binataceae bacterium]
MSTEADLNHLIAARASGEEARRLTIFSGQLFARATPEFLTQLSPERQLAIAQSGLDFFSRRESDLAVRIVSGADDEATVIETVMPDCAFIVDSLLEYFHGEGMPVRALFHPRFRVARDGAGNLESFETAAHRERAESFVHVELEIKASEQRLARLADDIRQILSEVRHAADDFERMTERALMICDETAAVRELVEMREFLRWLVRGGFVFLGYRRYRVESRNGARALPVELENGLGVLGEYANSRFTPPCPIDEFAESELRLLFDGPPLTITKSSVESHVHRRRPMDSVMVRRETAAGKIVGFDRFVGMFTSKAFAEEAQHIPILRAKLNDLIHEEGAATGSHDYKEIVAAFNSFPKEELFRASIEELRAQIRLLTETKADAAVRLNLLADPSRQQVIAFVLMPREAFSAEVRIRIQQALENRLKGKLLYYYLALGEGYIARLHFAFHAEAPSAALVRKIESEIAELARTWDDRLRGSLGHRFGAARAHEVMARWGLAFAPQYKAAFDVERAAADVQHLERLLSDGGFEVELNSPQSGAAEQAAELRMYALGEAPILSDLMPMLQNFGIRVLSEDAHRLSPLIDGKPLNATIESFLVQGPLGAPMDQLPGVAMLADAIAAVRANQAENDPLNALILTAGLRWREVALLRAYLAAAFQMRLAPARPALRRVFLSHPELAHIAIDLFNARFDPANSAAPDRIEQLKTRLLESLAQVDNIADDRIARAVFSMVEATVRTNYFLPLPSPDPYITLKFESAKIRGRPDTAPLYEIHVNSPRMEGCHLRAGRVARGGIRFSDRPDDFRSEILSLMKTQVVKNA